MEGCPPPKNDRRSVEVTHNKNSKLSLNNKNDNLYNNYNPINNFNPDDFLNEFDTGKVDIKINSNYNKPKLPIRPPSGKKILNDNARKLLNSKNANTNRENNINIINNELSNDKKDKERLSNKNINNINNNNSNKFGNYMNRQNDNKGAIPLKPIKDSKNIPNTSRYGNFNNNNNNKNTKRSSKPAFATNMSKTSLNSRKTTDKTSDEEFRKTREKFTFQNAKNIEKYHLNQNAIKMNNSKGFLNNDNFVGDFNFGEIDDEQQLLQQVIEQSLKDSKNK
jgi:translation initiation factor IF-2